MSATSRWAVGLLVAAAVVALVLFARGEPQRGGPSTSPAAVVITSGAGPSGGAAADAAKGVVAVEGVVR